MKKLGTNWLEVAQEAGLDLWERQPAELDIEWSIWCKYRDSYPFVVKPKIVDIAKDLGIDVKVVKDAYEIWDYTTRLQAWARFVDKLNIDKRQSALVEMNEKHISMARKINQKLELAIDLYDMDNLKPTDLKGLLALATDLERKATQGVAEAEKVLADTRNVSGDMNETKQGEVKKDDLQEIVDILAKSGMLKGTVGIKKTTTTEVLHRED
jgi:hypothetical protein